MRRKKEEGAKVIVKHERKEIKDMQKDFFSYLLAESIPMNEKSKSREYYDRVKERELEFRGKDYIQNRGLFNAEDVATARQVLIGLAEWLRSGVKPVWYKDPFHDEYMNTGIEILYDEVSGLLLGMEFDGKKWVPKRGKE